MTLAPLYTQRNCRAAYQLNWSLSVFGKSHLPSPACLLQPLRDSVAKDDLRILECAHRSPNVAQFFISSQPQAAPAEIVRSVKGRWQYLSRPTEMISFRRNYRITSVGTARSDVLDAYLRKQNTKHPMADARVQSMLELLQYRDPKINLTSVHQSSHDEFISALHVVLESESQWNETRQDVLQAYRSAIIGSCRKHGWMLSRIGILSDHLHILLGIEMTDSPQAVALVLLNNLAFTQRMKPVFRFSYYVGTYGAYDRGGIWNQLDQDAAPARASRTESHE